MAQGTRRGGDSNSVQYANEGARRGQYDNGNQFNKDRGNRQNYNRNIYYNDREEADRRHLASNSGAGSRYGEEHYRNRPYHQPPYQPPYQYQDYDRPVNSRPQITIYEDPRYVRKAPHRQYNDDYVDLEVKPRLDYRQNMRPYDYHY